MEIIAIIPARGGSKGIPRKNIISVAGKPLICYSIEAAKAAKFVNRLFVSTDDPEIEKVARDAGAEIVIRPKSISGDTAASEAALLHTLDSLKKYEDYIPDILVFLQCTSPLTLPEDIDGTIRMLLENDADTALAVAPFHYYLWRKDKKGEAEGINHDKSYRPMRQERANQYIETGAVYVIRVRDFLDKKHRFFGKTVMYEMPENRCLEIDEPIDLIIAEQLLLGKGNVKQG
jgi:CMP-N-acetylneuraminic acid synthetase